MKKNKLKKLGKASLIVVLSLIGLALIVPLLIKPEPLEGLKSIDEKAGISSRFVTIPFDGTDGIDLHYVESGEPSQDQPVFILLHGSLYNLYSWDRVLDFFGTRGMTYAYDQIPYGLSEKLLARDWSGPNPYTPEAAVNSLSLLWMPWTQVVISIWWDLPMEEHWLSVRHWNILIGSKASYWLMLLFL